jgi:microcystin degradation protein MlrC
MGKKVRIALLSFRLESNFHAPTVVKSDFVPNGYFAGKELGRMLEEDDPRLPKELIGFKQTMDSLREWEPVPIVVAGTGPGGPVDQNFFDEMKIEMQSRLKAALPLDAVYFAEHGAATATEEPDPDGVLFAMAREIAGPEAAIAASLDLHANVNTRMLDAVDMLCSFLTNPHVDQFERGRESAQAIHEMLNGQKTAKALAKLPMMCPSTSLNTKAGPYGDLIALGQEEARNPKVMNVSISAGFASGDTPKAGMSIAVTTRDDLPLAQDIAVRLADSAWKERHRYTTSLTPIPEAVAMMLKTGQDPSLPALLFADPADNPGGGGRGNTTYILKAMLEAECARCAFGLHVRRTPGCQSS